MTRRRLWAATALLSLAVAATGFFFWPDGGDVSLRPFVLGRPTYPVVFTSRTEPASFRAAASLGDYSEGGAGLVGMPQWQAGEGRLRVLMPSGSVRELTWNRYLPDGVSLTDVMSPSVGPDGKTVVFAGRLAGGRFRIYSVNLDGRALTQLTGGPYDPGCVTVPPARFDDKGQPLAADERRRTDYDDIDPTLLPGGILVFASSRTPDLGGRDRRATQIWIREPGKPPMPLTANRANDRWPFVASDRSIVFSLWSRQDEVIAADGLGLVRGAPGLTHPADAWLGATISPTGEQFGQVAKLPEPVWRPRPLFNGKIVFMTPAPGAPTPFTPANEHPERGRLAVAMTDVGRVAAAPSSLAAGETFPASDSPRLLWGPTRTADERSWSVATPSPTPPDGVLLAAAPLASDGTVTPGGYGIYRVAQEGWAGDYPSEGSLVPLFDDPAFVDAEPVAAYVRPVPPGPLNFPTAGDRDEWKAVTLAGGRAYKGVTARVHNEALYSDFTGLFPGQKPADGDGRIVPTYQPGSIHSFAVYASYRDRFDDPDRPVVRGGLEKLLDVPAKTESAGGFDATMPLVAPTLLLGLDKDGKAVSAVGAGGRRFYAFAGDHVSGGRPGGYHFCTGCHAGHTFNPVDIAERRN